MHFLPAIDLKDGQCVRLLRGDMDTATVFNDDPANQARVFESAGCAWLHVVDLNGAFEGQPVNADAIIQILKTVRMKVELGGGIRNMKTIDFWLSKGVQRVILGTAALRDPALAETACKHYPGQVAVGIDALGGFVAVKGWADVSKVKALDLARRFEDMGVAAIIYTDISRDGAMEGPNLKATIEMAKAVSIPIILSGGVSSMDDLRAIKATGGDIFEGLISGRAVYDGRIDPAVAVKLLK